MVKRYVVFSFTQYYPCGGWGDFVESFDDLEAAKAACRRIETPGDFMTAQLIDLYTGEEIFKYEAEEASHA